MIDFADYISEERKTEIVEDEFRAAIKDKLKTQNDVERFVGNISYQIVAAAVDGVIEDGLTEALTVKVSKLVSELSSFSVFREKDRYSPEDSPAQKLLDKAVADNSHLIDAKVRELLAELDIDNIAGYVGRAVSGALRDSLEDAR